MRILLLALLLFEMIIHQDYIAAYGADKKVIIPPNEESLSSDDDSSTSEESSSDEAGQPRNTETQQPQRRMGQSRSSDLELGGLGGLVKCPIYDRSIELRRSISPSYEDVRSELSAAVDRASRYRTPECQTVGRSLGNLSSLFGTSQCENDPHTCASMLEEILPTLSTCTEDRENLGDMATSVALFTTAGSPAGLVSLGVSAIRSIVRLFSGGGQRRGQRAQDQRIAQQRREVIEAAASCALMSLYQGSICAPEGASSVRGILDSLNPSPFCTDRTGLGEMSVSQKLTAMRGLESCTTAPSPDLNVCFSNIGQQFRPPVTGTAQPGERAACLVEEVLGIGANVQNIRTSDIPEFLRLARRHHTREIIQIRNRLNGSDLSVYSGTSERNSLILHCFYGKLSRSLSSGNIGQPLSTVELNQQDRSDREELRNVAEEDRILLAENMTEVDRICNNLDNCFRSNPNLLTLDSHFGPTAANLEGRMCNGIGRFHDYGTNFLNGRLGSMERAIRAGGNYGERCGMPVSAEPVDGAGASAQ
jgi:hypothetical protein